MSVRKAREPAGASSRLCCTSIMRLCPGASSIYKHTAASEASEASSNLSSIQQPQQQRQAPTEALGAIVRQLAQLVTKGRQVQVAHAHAVAGGLAGVRWADAALGGADLLACGPGGRASGLVSAHRGCDMACGVHAWTCGAVSLGHCRHRGNGAQVEETSALASACKMASQLLLRDP